MWLGLGREANREEGAAGQGHGGKAVKGQRPDKQTKAYGQSKKTVTVKHLSWSLFLKLMNKKGKKERRRRRGGLDSRVTRLDQEGVGSRPV